MQGEFTMAENLWQRWSREQSEKALKEFAFTAQPTWKLTNSGNPKDFKKSSERESVDEMAEN
jgi:hypothetical protein